MSSPIEILSSGEEEEANDAQGSFLYLAGQDYKVRVSRRRNTPIRSHEDLTQCEKVALMDLLSGYDEMYEGHDVEGGRGQMYVDFFREIFRDWTSEDGSGAPPEWRERTFHDTNVMVGILARDHPEPNTTRRRVNRPEEGKAPVLAPVVIETDNIPTKSKHRKAGRPVYLSLTLNMEEGTHAWLWRDEGRQWINPKYVTYNPGLTSAKACEMVINHYDRHERKRLSAWNREVTTFLSRRRIVEWKTDGSVSGGRVDPNDRLGLGVIQKLVLASDTVGQGMSQITGLAPERILPNVYPLPRMRRDYCG
ncbi:hypothetical protein Neosp_004145 [[Neocosmospora] mangrovei]